MTNKELQDIDNQWREMNRYLFLNFSSGKKHDYVFDRLVWLKKRLKTCLDEGNHTPILYYFNETICFFNQELEISDKEKFKEK